MRVAPLLPVVVLLSSAAMGCYPEQINSMSQAVTVTTLVDSQAPLKAALTFALPDTIVHPARAQGSDVIGHEHDAAILASIRTNLTNLGWQEITNVAAERPDVVVLTAVLEQTNTGVAYSDWWGSWGYWPGWPIGYGPDWFWGYPVNAVTFQYETGTLLIVMLDLAHGDPTLRRVPILWAAALNGVVEIATPADVLDGVNQAFVQSPYLERP